MCSECGWDSEYVAVPTYGAVFVDRGELYVKATFEDETEGRLLLMRVAEREGGSLVVELDGREALLPKLDREWWLTATLEGLRRVAVR